MSDMSNEMRARVTKTGRITDKQQLRGITEGAKRDGYNKLVLNRSGLGPDVSHYWFIEFDTRMPKIDGEESWPAPVTLRVLYVGTPESLKHFLRGLEEGAEEMERQRQREAESAQQSR